MDKVQIALVLETTVPLQNPNGKLADSDELAALQTQISEQFAPIWGKDAKLEVCEKEDSPPIGSWWLVIADTSDQASARGYHELTTVGLPLGKVFVKTAIETGTPWTVTASHELLEMLADGGLNECSTRYLNDGDSIIYAREVCDPCGSPKFSYRIKGIPVCDFVYPAWFGEAGNRFDYAGHITRAYALLPDGYATVQDQRAGPEWRQIDAGSFSDRRNTRPQVGSRRSRIRIPNEQRRRSELSASLRSNRADSPVRNFFHTGDSARDRKPIILSAAGHPILVFEELDRLEKELEEKKAFASRDRNRELLGKAREQLRQHSQLNGELPEELHASLLLSALSGQIATGSRPPLAMDEIGFGKYQELDLGWTQAGIDYLLQNFDAPITFPTNVGRKIDAIVNVQDKVRIGIVGDWGTGNQSSRNITTVMEGLSPDHTIHLGDIYYAGTPPQAQSNFLDPGLWQAGRDPGFPSFALNGNHEMYSGGHAYFTKVLADQRFSGQRGISYFALENANWVIVALDTAYYATKGTTYLDGALEYPAGQYSDGTPIHNDQVVWFKQRFQAARTAGKRVILLSHHDGFEMDPRTLDVLRKGLWYEVESLLEGDGPDFWYWGHVHAGIAFQAVKNSNDVSVICRCVGHGGVPYAPYPTPLYKLGDPEIRFDWAETTPAGDPADKVRAANGLVMINLDGKQLVEEFWDEYGNRKYSKTY